MTEHPNVTVTQTVAEAVELARTAPVQTRVFITGSLFVVGEAREMILSSRLE